jgi:hypothetical protein
MAGLFAVSHIIASSFLLAMTWDAAAIPIAVFGVEGMFRLVVKVIYNLAMKSRDFADRGNNTIIFGLEQKLQKQQRLLEKPKSRY